MKFILLTKQALNKQVYVSGSILISVTLFLFVLTGCSCQNSTSSSYEKTVSYADNRIHIYSSEITDTIDIIQMSDTHLFMKDEREKSFEKYSKRMSEAYNVTKHYRTGENTCPQQCFVETVEMARAKNVDLLALTGDLFSYPSEAAIEWVDSILSGSGLRYAYTTGNHDWHYEGMEGSSADLRQTWINNRLLSLYQGQNPLYYAVDLKGLRVIMIDNSTYEISSEQLGFFKQQAKSGLPLLLMMHIPLYAPGRPVGYGCGHPDWNQRHDNGYKIERRMFWPEEGHTPVTMQFRDVVLNTPNLLAVFTGHIHRQTVDVIHDIPQFVVKENASGNFYHIRIIPLGDK
jgi:hypothetical protein